MIAKNLYDEKLFFAEYRKTQDPILCEYILRRNKRLAYKITREFSTEALLTLWNCIKIYDPSTNLTFGTYASMCIKRCVWKLRKKHFFQPIGIEAALDMAEKKQIEVEVDYGSLRGAEMVIVMRRYFLDESFQEIADALHIGKAAVLITHAQALRKLHAAQEKLRKGEGKNEKSD